MSMLGDVLKMWRRTFDLTQREAARELHVSPGHISRIERGAHLPPLNEERRMESIVEGWFKGAEAQKDWAPL